MLSWVASRAGEKDEHFRHDSGARLTWNAACKVVGSAFCAIAETSKEHTMMHYSLKSLLRMMPVAAIVMIPSLANAKLDSCGGIFLSADASCEFHKTQECVDTCKVVSVEESCAAQLYTTCENKCSTTATTECTQMCSPVCVDQCKASPSPETSAKICQDDCMADCNSKCSDAKNPSCCAKACPYTCDRKCEERCHDDDQTMDCTPKCATACDGTCTSTTNTSCQVECQTTQWESCKTTTREECTRSCMDKGGAIVCNGEFVNASNLKDCAAELSAKVSIDLDVDVDVNVAAHVVTNAANKTSKKATSISCALGRAPSGGDGAYFAVAALGGALLLRRRSSR